VKFVLLAAWWFVFVKFARIQDSLPKKYTHVPFYPCTSLFLFTLNNTVTTILVPLVQATLTSSTVTATTWMACLIALSGIAIMGLDDGSSAEAFPSQLSFLPSSTLLASSSSLTTGDVLILCAAVVYSLHVVRLGRWANVTSPLQLVAYKTTTELILGLVLLATTTSMSATTTTGDMLVVTAISDNSSIWTFLQESGREIVDFFNVVSERLRAGTLSSSSIQLALVATLWTGLVSTAYTTYAQSFGQRRGVSPTNANLIYSMQPIATAAVAYVLLGETMGPFGILGGTLIGTAVYVAASQSFATATTTTTTLQDEKEE
jgi:drug/metabolite transporter (DMT)-like permease